MLRFLGPGTRLCDGRSRREILRVGGLGLLGAGLGLPDLVSASGTSGESSFGRVCPPARGPSTRKPSSRASRVARR